mmetsp:Transcript_7893/g.7826  ORF Transcript_7893/g.7826 Transcript_7893/m.7826 type:complete len:275 (-) Transcript_7893:38-862(-)
MNEFNVEDFKKYDKFLVSEVEEGFYHVQFNNPKTLNAFTEQVWRDYAEILEKLDKYEETNVILISSAVPKAFSSGLDLKDAIKTMASTVLNSEKERFESLHKHITDFQYCIATPTRIRTPTICLMNGVNYGLALDISSACSIRVAIADCKFSIREIKIGIPADIGSLQRLPSIVNNKSLMYQYALTGDIFGADEATKLDFISAVLPDLNAGINYCKELGKNINQHQQWAIKGTKESIQHIIDNGSPSEGLKNIARYNATHIDGRFIRAMSGIKL